MLTLPSEQDLAIAIAQTSLPITKKEEILRQLRYMSEERVIALYGFLLELHTLEQEVVQKVEQTDLKYRIKFEQEIEKANE